MPRKRQIIAPSEREIQPSLCCYMQASNGRKNRQFTVQMYIITHLISLHNLSQWKCIHLLLTLSQFLLHCSHSARSKSSLVSSMIALSLSSQSFLHTSRSLLSSSFILHAISRSFSFITLSLLPHSSANSLLTTFLMSRSLSFHLLASASLSRRLFSRSSLCFRSVLLLKGSNLLFLMWKRPSSFSGTSISLACLLLFLGSVDTAAASSFLLAFLATASETN